MLLVEFIVLQIKKKSHMTEVWELLYLLINSFHTLHSKIYLPQKQIFCIPFILNILTWMNLRKIQNICCFKVQQQT